MSQSSLEYLTEVEQLLFREARLLDQRDYQQWLDLWTEDCRYFVPVRNVIASKPGKPVRPIQDELEDDMGAAWVDDRKQLMEARVARLNTGKAWSENPPARTRRFISNVEVQDSADSNSVDVYSNLLLYRNRRDRETTLLSCQRRDSLVRHGDTWLFNARTVILDSDVLDSSYVTFF